MIHSTAIVSPKAIIAENVEVGPYSIIGDDVEVGSGTRLASHVVINGPTKIGENNRVFQFASIGDEPQDKKYRGEPTRLEIGNGNTIREYVTINRGTTQDDGLTSIGDNNWLMAYVHIAHDCKVGNETIFANCGSLAGHCIVEDYVIFGGMSGAHQFTRIGAHSFIGNNTSITRDVPPYVLVSGHPAVPKGINSEGLKRRGFDADQVRVIKKAFRLLYRSDLRLEEARERINELAEDHQVLESMRTFLALSTRSIVR
jgi:UDP-N-acetylglucosamine acyltransferase